MTTLPRDAAGREYGTADQLAALLTTPARCITAATIRKWAWRSRRPGDPLYGKLPAIHIGGERTGTTWYRLRDAAEVSRVTRRS